MIKICLFFFAEYIDVLSLKYITLPFTKNFWNILSILPNKYVLGIKPFALSGEWLKYEFFLFFFLKLIISTSLNTSETNNKLLLQFEEILSNDFFFNKCWIEKYALKI